MGLFNVSVEPTPAPDYVDMLPIFGGVVDENGFFSVPSDAHPWAGFEHRNFGGYYTFEGGGSLSFSAELAAGDQQEAFIRFHDTRPDGVGPVHQERVVITSDQPDYRIDVPAIGSGAGVTHIWVSLVSRDTPVRLFNIELNSDTPSADDISDDAENPSQTTVQTVSDDVYGSVLEVIAVPLAEEGATSGVSLGAALADCCNRGNYLGGDLRNKTLVFDVKSLSTSAQFIAVSANLLSMFLSI
jgi:hypothetical protein